MSKELTDIRKILSETSKYAKTDTEKNLAATLLMVIRELEFLWTRLIDLERQFTEHQKDSPAL